MRSLWRDDHAAAPIIWGFIILGTVATGAWGVYQGRQAAEELAETSGSLAPILAGSTIMLLGAFLIGLAAWKNNVRFVPLGVVLLIAGLPFLGFTFDVIGQLFGGSS